MFYDLNIRRQNLVNSDGLEELVERLFKYGYRGFAITTDVDESIFEKSKKKNSGNTVVSSFIPVPPDLKNLKMTFPKAHFYQRINIIISESSNIRKFIQCKNFKKYDLVSFQPENQTVLKSLTSVADVDIVSYNPENKCDLSFNRKLYNQFVNQNVYFELMYAPAIKDSTARRNILSISHMYHAIGKSKNVIVTSGAQIAAHVRGPYDVINLNFLFGLKEEQSKSSISKNCERVILRARKQRRSKTTIEMIQQQSKLSENSLKD